jgi:hypothetical protein
MTSIESLRQLFANKAEYAQTLDMFSAYKNMLQKRVSEISSLNDDQKNLLEIRSLMCRHQLYDALDTVQKIQEKNIKMKGLSELTGRTILLVKMADHFESEMTGDDVAAAKEFDKLFCDGKIDHAIKYFNALLSDEKRRLLDIFWQGYTRNGLTVPQKINFSFLYDTSTRGEGLKTFQMTHFMISQLSNEQKYIPLKNAWNQQIQFAAGLNDYDLNCIISQDYASKKASKLEAIELVNN